MLCADEYKLQITKMPSALPWKIKSTHQKTYKIANIADKLQENRLSCSECIILCYNDVQKSACRLKKRKNFFFNLKHNNMKV